MHNSSYDLLSWDSQFFKFPVGKLNAIEQCQTEVQSQLANIVQSPPCRLLYIYVDLEDATTQEYVTQLGARLVDNRMVFRKNIEAFNLASSTIGDTPLEVYTGSEGQELNELAFLAGEYSRYRTDPEISEIDFQRLYSLWIERSISGIIADKVMITRDQQNTPVSLITLTCKEGTGSIGLLAVRADQQGKGLGKILVNQALDFFSQKHCTTAEVVTQGTNSAACKLYQHSGFIPVLSSLTYHLWLPFSSTLNNVKS